MTNFGKRITIRQWKAMLDEPPVRECDEEASAMLARVLALVEAAKATDSALTIIPDVVTDHPSNRLRRALAAMKEAGDI